MLWSFSILVLDLSLYPDLWLAYEGLDLDLEHPEHMEHPFDPEHHNIPFKHLALHPDLISICLHRRYVSASLASEAGGRFISIIRDELLLLVLLSLLWRGDSNAKVLVPSALGGV